MTVVSSGTTKNVSSGETSTNDIIQSGGTEYVGRFNNFGGGTAISALVDGGAIYYEADGIGSGLIVRNGGSAMVDNGAVLSNGVVEDGGLIEAYYQGNTGGATSGSAHLYSTVVSSGGELRVKGGAAASNTTVYKGGVEHLGSYNVYGGGTDTDGVVSGGTLYVEANGVATGTKITSDGLVYLDNGGILSGATVESGGVISAFWQGNNANGAYYAGSALSTTIGNGGNLIVGSGAISSDAHILSGGKATLTNSGAVVSNTVLDRDGSIDFDYLSGNIVSASISSNGLLSATADNGSSTTLQLAGTYASNTYLRYNGDTVTLVCFLAGAMIETPDGARAVETLAQGDAVTTFGPAGQTTERLSWAGRAQHVVARHLPPDEAGYPVRIRQGALAEGTPTADLLLTPEHCLFMNGTFVPVRMLVNNASIIYDTDITSYEYYHVETQSHAVIMANGALTESFLDTGNRASFQQGGRLARLDRKVRSWADDAAAPLTTDRQTVEPLYRTLADRAASLGYGAQAAHTTLQHDPELHLVTEGGDILHPVRQKGGHYVFHLPPRSENVTIRSRTARPSDVIGAFVDDRRALGVLVGDIQLFSPNGAQTIEAPFVDAALPGWDVIETAHCRWTNGAARLPVGTEATGGVRVLGIRVLACGPYLQDEVTLTAVA